MDLALFVLIVLLIALISICYIAKFKMRRNTYELNHVDLTIPNAHEFILSNSQNINSPPAYEEAIAQNSRISPPPPSLSPPPSYIVNRSYSSINL